jgi:hypothetical protein
MRGTFASVVMMIAACGAPGVANQTDAGTEGDAAAPVTDRDGDGLPDTADNCPDVANHDQANEDGDGFGDVCDPCPQLADAAIADTDGDQIGDACDPNPGTRDMPWLFEGFHGGVPAWPGTVNWAPAGDKIQVTASGLPTQAAEYLDLPLTRSGRSSFDNYSVTAFVTIGQLSGGTEHDLGIGFYDADAVKELNCMLAEVSGNRILWLFDDNGLNMAPAFPWMNGVEYKLRLTRHGASYTCDVSGAGTSMNATNTSTVTPRNGAATDLWAFGMTAQFGSVAVIGP